MRKHRKTLAFLTTLTVPLFLACGGGGGGGGDDSADSTESTVASLTAADASEVSAQADCSESVPMPASLDAPWNETEQCTDLSAAPPRIILSATVNCPRSGQPNCLATVPFFPCSDNPSQTCGAIGRFLPDCGAIELPDRYSGAAAHEMIHYLLLANRRGDWADHSAPEFACQ